MANNLIETGIVNFLNTLINQVSFTDTTATITNFKISQYIKEVKGNFTMTMPDGIYSTKTEEFIPCAIQEFNGDFEPIDGEEIADFSIGITFFVKYDNNKDKVVYNQTLNDINSFRQNLIGKFYNLEDYIGDGIDDYNTVWTSSTLDGVGNSIEWNGQYYDEIELTLSLDLGKNINFGNQNKYFISKNVDGAKEVNGEVVPDTDLTLEELILVDRQHDRAKTMESQQLIGNQDVINLAKTNVWGLDFAFYDNVGIIKKEIKRSVDDDITYGQNQVYYLSIQDPDYTILNRPVLVEGVSKIPQLGKKVVIQGTFVKKYEVV